jgi:hypothetical protein
MDEIRHVLGQASRRLWVTDTLRTLTITACIVLTLLLLTLVGDRLFAWSLPWSVIAWAAAGVWVVAALVWSVATRHGPLSVARIVDDRAGLKESLSTAMCVTVQDDPWSKAVVENAAAVAKTVRVGDSLPISAPRLWPVPLALGLVLAMVAAFMTPMDLFGVRAEQVAKEQKLQAVAEVKADLERKEQEIKAALAKANIQLPEKPADSEKDSPDKQTPKDQDPDSLRREAIRNLTDLTDRLQSEKEGEKAAQAAAQKEAMRQLKQPGDGPLNEFSRALSRGDFNKAQEELKQLATKMADGSMSPADKEKAKAQMQKLSKQLKDLAENHEQVAKALQKAGLDKKTAEELARQAMKDPEALKKALEQTPMSAEQKQQMLEMAKNASKACDKAGRMGEGMSKMAQGMTQDGLQQEGQEGMESLEKELSESEMLSEDMQNLDAALEQAKSQLADLGECLGGQCDNPGSNPGKGATGGWKPGESAGKQGPGSGGPGQSSGGASPDAVATDIQYQKEKAAVQTQAGAIIGSRLVFGEAVKGESTAEFSTVVEAGSREAAEAMDSMQIPREFHDAVKHYFGRLERKVKKETPAAPAPAAAPASQPK